MVIQTIDNKLELFNYLVDLERLPDQEIHDMLCSHYRGKVDQDAYVNMLVKRQETIHGHLPQGFSDALELTRRQDLAVELWIDPGGYISQQRVAFRFPKQDLGSVEETWVVGYSTSRYSDFNDPIVIQPPEMRGQ
jgi:hypothetical protein